MIIITWLALVILRGGEGSSFILNWYYIINITALNKRFVISSSDCIENKVKYDNRWIYRFKKRHSLQKIKYLGEANSILFETLLEECLKLQKFLSEYNKEDIYNANETRLFFRIESN